MQRKCRTGNAESEFLICMYKMPRVHWIVTIYKFIWSVKLYALYFLYFIYSEPIQQWQIFFYLQSTPWKPLSKGNLIGSPFLINHHNLCYTGPPGEDNRRLICITYFFKKNLKRREMPFTGFLLWTSSCKAEIWWLRAGH